MEKFSKKRQYAIIAFLIVVFFSFGVLTGASNRPAIEKITGITGKETAVEITADFSSFWEAWNTINEKSPNASKITNQERIYGAISGLVSSLNDPYSVFFKPEDAKSFAEVISGNFEGIGMEVGMKDKVLTVIAPLKDTPAYRANIKSGDKILKIDNTVTTDLTIERAIKLIRGPKGTTVTLTIFREGEKQPREIKIVRDVVSIPTLDTELRPDGIFVIKLYNFDSNASRLFRGAMKGFVDAKTDKLLLDLRGNPGGYLDSAVNMASWFLPTGKTVVTEDYGEKKKEDVYRSKGYDIFNDKLKFVILIDGGSASEILAGAMQDHKKATLVGEQSFGKGSVQEVIKLTPDTLLKLTVAKWLTPNGTSISEKGLTPDYKVEVTQKDLDAKIDAQLNKAVELLLQK